MNTTPSALRTAAAIVGSTLTLFCWSGLCQVFPWGVPTVRTFAETSAEPSAFGAVLQRVTPGTLTTGGFDEQLGDGIATLTTDRSFAWVVSVPLRRYDPTRYFLGELLCQLVCSMLLVLGLRLLEPVPRPRRLAIVGLLAAAATVGTYGVMTNWWGLPLRYSGGMSVNLVIGWLLGAAVITFVLERRAGDAARGFEQG